ncbi:Alpha/Beta hydrolase protein [Rhypophila decipiens]|uniref:Alpha/Beta hydrolase protein n=1 Tax=Rhypophila decipiens TaxID=261697 RepID=A0AAN6Y5Z9_9PEZI|nr:Alpha/Beta hydrolase protein [Rhypophila decipiens]
MSTTTDKIQPCCLTGFRWSGTPQGEEITCYISKPANASNSPSSSKKRAILQIHDLFGWTFPNNRLLADHYAAETNSTVYLPDFFDGLVIPSDLIAQEKWDQIDLAGFTAKNSREIREPEVFGWARYLGHELGFEKLGAVGFCFGGWAVFRLASLDQESGGLDQHGDGKRRLVDCISAGHPTWLKESDVDGASTNVGVQVLSTEVDQQFNPQLKAYTFNKLQERGVPFEWVHFPGVGHGCLARGDENIKGEREALVRGKNAVVGFMRQWLGTD